MIDDLPDISRIAAGKMTLDREPLRLGPLIAQSVESLSLRGPVPGLGDLVSLTPRILRAALPFRGRPPEMARAMESAAKRPRISVDVLPEVRRRLRLAAAKRDVTLRQYVLEAIEDRLQEDLGDHPEETSALTAKTDPVLAELWDNAKDSAYDRL